MIRVTPRSVVLPGSTEMEYDVEMDGTADIANLPTTTDKKVFVYFAAIGSAAFDNTNQVLHTLSSAGWNPGV